jgi:hypothetical protein
MLPRPALRGEGWGEGPLMASQVMQVGPAVPGTRACAGLPASPRNRGEVIVSHNPERHSLHAAVVWPFGKFRLNMR